MTTTPAAQALPSIKSLEVKQRKECAVFSDWVATVPDKHWAKLDLSALRIGYELGVALTSQAGGEAAWQYRHIDGALISSLWRECDQYLYEMLTTEQYIGRIETRALYAPYAARPALTSRASSDAEKARAEGFTVDRHAYPWFAYRGPRFNPIESKEIRTDLECATQPEPAPVVDAHDGRPMTLRECVEAEEPDTGLLRAARNVLATELGDMACVGSHAPCEDALGLLRVAVEQDTERAGVPDDVAEQNIIRAVVAFHEICDALDIPRMEQEPCADRALAAIATLTSAPPDVQSGLAKLSKHHREHMVQIEQALERIGVRLLYADDGSLARATKEPPGGLSFGAAP